MLPCARRALLVSKRLRVAIELAPRRISPSVRASALGERSEQGSCHVAGLMLNWGGGIMLLRSMIEA